MTANDGRHADAALESMRRWLEQIVATLPEPRQRMYDLLVARGLDSRRAALELGTGVAEVRRLRRENREAVLRAFEVTALAAAETAALAEPWREAPGCGELRRIMADAQHDGSRRHFPVLPAALRLSVSRHLSQCATCQDRRADCMASWAPALLAIIADPDLDRDRQAAQDTGSMPGQGGSAPGAHRLVSPAGPARNVVVRRAAATGAGLLVALPLLAFAWPGFLHGNQGAAAVSSQAATRGVPGGTVAPHVAGTADVAADSNRAHPAPPTASGVLSRLSPTATASIAAQAYTALPPSVYYTVQPSPSPSLGQPTSASAPASTPSPSPAAPQTTSLATSATPSSRTPSASPTSAAPSATPTPSVATSTPAPVTSSSPAAASPDPAASASDTAPSSSEATPTAAPSDSTAS